MALWSSAVTFEYLNYWAVPTWLPLWRASSNQTESRLTPMHFIHMPHQNDSWYLLVSRLFRHMDCPVPLLPWIKERKAALWKKQTTSHRVLKKPNKPFTFFFLCFFFFLSGNLRMFTWDVGDPSHWSLCFESGSGLDLGSPHLRWAPLAYCSEVALPINVLLAVNRNATLQQRNLLIWFLSELSAETFSRFLFSW